MRHALIALFLSSCLPILAAEPVEFSFFIQGRNPMDPVTVNGPANDLEHAAVFSYEPVVLAVAAVNVPESDLATWWTSIQWSITTVAGARVEPSPKIEITDARDRGFEALRPRAAHINFSVSGLGPGRYIFHATRTDPTTGETTSARDRMLSIYRGDENLTVKRTFLRERAALALSKGTRQDFEAARSMLLEAAEGNPDPLVFESLADASAPWANPDETASYYERALAITRQNLEERLGKQRSSWPPTAVRQWNAQERKLKAFREILPYYKANFQQVRVVVVRAPRSSEKFVVERRSDGARLRTIETNH
ncbi:MAG TPA: hypothetical protein VGQ76_23815 [Thermoanaerobaculia bacterium]|nr:hypothetical protein [Thermoanaerobaculia bacterium]